MTCAILCGKSAFLLHIHENCFYGCFITLWVCVCALMHLIMCICDLLWRNREQVARQMFLILAVQYCMTNIGPIPYTLSQT